MANEPDLSIKHMLITSEINYKSQNSRHFCNIKENHKKTNCGPLMNFSFGGKIYKECESNSNELRITETDENIENTEVQTATATINKFNNCVSVVNNSKMGSRRIFTPQFKIQVLESYRNDTDCKGNQRATARKYNIHRRQIQKWLQCETNLRSSIANNNQNNIKHQFHNISHQPHNHHQQQPLTQVLTTPVYTKTTSNASISKKCTDQCSQFTQQYGILPLAAARHNVSIEQEEFESKKLKSTPAGISRDETSSPSKILSVSKTVPVSPLTVLRQGNLESNGSSCSASSIDQRNIHEMYTHTPSVFLNSMAVPVPDPTHHHHRNYHELSYLVETGTDHYESHKYHDLTRLLPLPQQSNMCSFMPSTSLPIETFPSSCTYSIETAFPIRTMSVPVPTATDIVVRTDSLHYSLAGNGYVHNDEYVTRVHGTLNSAEKINYQNVQQYHYNDTLQQTVSPIDLSIGRQRERGDFQQLCAIVVDSAENPTTEAHDSFMEVNSEHTARGMDNSAVDLSCRKRKATVENNLFFESPTKIVSIPSIKKEQNGKLSGPTKSKLGQDIKVDVEKTQPIKPVKLFKPYLLGKNENEVGSIKKEGCNETLPKSRSTDISTFPVGSSIFRTDSSEITTALRCPKGSPVSGYESSSSTYSDTSFGSGRCTEKTYNIGIRMQPIKVNVDCYHEDIIYDEGHTFSSYTHNQDWVGNVSKIGLQQSIILYA